MLGVGLTTQVEAQERPARDVDARRGADGVRETHDREFVPATRDAVVSTTLVLFSSAAALTARLEPSATEVTV